MNEHVGHSMMAGAGEHAAHGARSSATGIPVLDFFTGDGRYMPRIHCMVDEAGTPDWGWIWALFILNIVVIAGYLKVFRFWRQAYLETEVRDRNGKLMDLAWIFLLCAVCGYVASVLMFFWPGYRLLAVFLVPLAFFTWKFALNLEPFRVSLSAKRLERELAESLERRNGELEALVSERTAQLSEALKRADQASTAKSLFVANLSHEIRTPMNAIVGFTDLLEDDVKNPELHAQHLKTIRRNTAHLLELINNILDMSKIEAGKLELEYRATAVNRIVGDVRELFEGVASGKGLTIVLQTGAEVPEFLRLDPTRLRQIVTNLVSNAIKFTERGTVTIATGYECGTKRLTVRVRDTGPGMSVEVMGRLFESFTQADASTTRKHGGTGLGLKISRDLARLMGGDVSVSSVEGEGTCFTVEIVTEAMEGEKAGQPVNAGEGESGTALKGVRVLLVEDGDDNARLATHHLTRAGATVERAEDGLVALTKVGDGSGFDVVLMDMQMPVMDGQESTRRMRARGVKVAIVAATANARVEDRVMCLECGCDDFLTKPYRRAELIEIVGRNAERVRGVRAA